MVQLIKYFRRISRFIGRKVYLLLVLMLVVGFIEGIGVSLFLPILQSGFGDDNLSRMLKYIFGLFHIGFSFNIMLGLIAAFFIIKGALSVAYARYFGKISAGLVVTLRRKLLDKIFRADYLYILKKEIGYLNNAMVREIERVADAFEKFSFVLNYAVYGLVYLALAMGLNYKASLAALAASPILIAMMRRLNLAINTTSLDLSDSHGRFNSILIQALNKFKYLKATLSGGKIGRIVNRENEGLAGHRFRLFFLQSLSKNILEPVAMLVIVGLIFYHAAILKRDVNGIIFLVFLLLQVARQFLNVQTSYRKFLASMGSIETFNRITAELDANAEDLNPSGRKPDFNEAIRFNRASLVFPNGKKALEETDITIKPMAITAFVGHSGSGKSSVANMVAGILKPTRGDIFFGDVDYRELDLAELRKNIGYVTQEDIIFNASVKDNISLWSGSPEEERLERVVGMAHISDFVRGLSGRYEEVLGDNGLDISGGQRQRVTIARELYKDSKLLILDEATSSLDSKSERNIYENLKEYKGKKTMIVIAHRLSTIKNADYIYVMDEGRIIEEGTYDQLARKEGEFTNMVREQTLI
jgi:subfamily B ATP-binding cassette protein MsbA